MTPDVSLGESAYRLRIARSATRALAETLPDKVTSAAYEFITGPLLDDPHRVGTPLNPPMAPAWTARRGSYRILYRIDDAGGIVEVTAVRHRSDAYRG
ncbi:type II toxin-antitoxin system RelE/ParE family toxin [Pseudonocardia sp.]|uniref:type II toxin-antitoxin system RelE family toxin n=1 Tax=Pseudonocardia sp. TaxID=60912 RepID=UPI002624F35C|nr:type II toxin-antitoxin system RelE/ParE family toxin [Pseudonocardia sp.]